MADPAFLTRLSRELADKGKLIEAGWVALRASAIPRDAPPEQLACMRFAYMAGAQHLFASIMTVLDDDHAPTPADVRRLDLIDAELNAFRNELLRGLPERGSA